VQRFYIGEKSEEKRKFGSQLINYGNPKNIYKIDHFFVFL